MDNDPELREWTSDWQAGDDREGPGDAIRVYAHGRRRFMWKWALSEAAVGIIALPLLAYQGWTSTDAVERWSMGLLALIVVAAMGVGWWNWRGSLLASARTTADYLAVSAERLRRMRQAWRLGWVVLVAEVAVFSVWIWNMLYAGGRDHSPLAERFSWGWLAFMSIMAVAFLWRMDRWIRKDEEKFESLRRELDMPDNPVTSPGPHPPASGPGRAPRLQARVRSGNRAVPH